MEEYEINKIEKFDIMGLERKLQGTNENNEAKEKENDLKKKNIISNSLFHITNYRINCIYLNLYYSKGKICNYCLLRK